MEGRNPSLPSTVLQDLVKMFHIIHTPPDIYSLLICSSLGWRGSWDLVIFLNLHPESKAFAGPFWHTRSIVWIRKKKSSFFLDTLPEKENPFYLDKMHIFVTYQVEEDFLPWSDGSGALCNLGSSPTHSSSAKGLRAGTTWTAPCSTVPGLGAQIPPPAGLSHAVLLPPGFHPEEWAPSISSFIPALLPVHLEGATTFSGPRIVLFYLTENVSDSW